MYDRIMIRAPYTSLYEQRGSQWFQSGEVVRGSWEGLRGRVWTGVPQPYPAWVTCFVHEKFPNLTLKSMNCSAFWAR